AGRLRRGREYRVVRDDPLKANPGAAIRTSEPMVSCDKPFALALAVLFSGALGLSAQGLAQTRNQAGAELVWAGDPEGGAPYVEADPQVPDRIVGFEVEVADLIARGLGRTPRFVNITFMSIEQSIERGDADIGLSGIEDTDVRRATFAPTVPYYEFREV